MKSIAQIAREEDARAVRRMFARFRRRPFPVWLASRVALVLVVTAILGVVVAILEAWEVV